jgi:AcrR family transcriptional regulator
MPIIVDKEEKVKLICERAFEEFIKYGIENISLNQIIINIGISKGQFYHYFKTKEDLIFEVMSQKTIQIFQECEIKLKKSDSLKESLFILFEIYINNDKNALDIRKILFDSLYIYTHSTKEEVKTFNTEYYEWIENKLIEIFEFHNHKSKSINFIKSISSTADGMYIRSLADRSFNLQNQLKSYLIDISENI